MPGSNPSSGGTGTFSTLTIPYSGFNNVTLTRGIAAGGNGSTTEIEELGVRSNSVNNSLYLQNLNTGGFSCLAIRSDTGYDKVALGYGGATSNQAFRGMGYLEINDAELENGGVAPRFSVKMTGTYAGGALTYNFYDRISLETDGSIIVWRRDSTVFPGGNEGAPVATFSPTAPILTLGGNGIDNVSNYGELRGNDSHHALVLRDPSRASVASATVYNYGGTLASGAGFAVYSGGLRGSQTKKLHVADDAMASITPASAPSDASLFAGSVSFYLDEGGNNLKVKAKYSGGTVKTGTVALV